MSERDSLFAGRFSLGSLTDDERRAFDRYCKSGVQSPFAFPAPEGCRSHEDWIRDGDKRWGVLRSKVFRELPTAWSSPMLARGC